MRRVEVAAAVLLREGMQLTVEALQQHIGAKLAAFKVPSIIHIADTQLPRNASGKILKRDLRDALAERLGRG